MLQERYDALAKKYDKTEILEFPIMSQPDDDTKRCAPAQLRTFSRKALTEGARIPPDEIQLPNKASGEAADLSQYQGDLYRSNFKYRVLGICDMTLGEACYLLGVQSNDTFSRHYCDYSNDFAQLSIATRLERWKTQYTKFDGAPTIQPFKVEQRPIRHTAPAINPNNAALEIHLEIPPTGDDAEVEIELDSQYGVVGSAVLVKKS